MSTGKYKCEMVFIAEEAFIIEDYRPGGHATGMRGAFVKWSHYDHKWPDGNTSSLPTAEILLYNGETIWGYECWWTIVDYVAGSLTQAQIEEIEKHKQAASVIETCGSFLVDGGC